MTATPVPPGTAEALAVVAHLERLPDTIGPDCAELRRVWRLLIGPVTDREAVYDAIHDELLQLWRLVSCDWNHDDLDALPDKPQFDGLTDSQAREIAHERTVDRLVADVEGYIGRQRALRAAERHAVTVSWYRRAHGVDLTDAGVYGIPAPDPCDCDAVPGEHTEDQCTPPCPDCRGAGGWQQHDGLIVECPRGCITGGGQ